MDVASVDHPPVLARRPTRSRARPFRLAAAARSCRRAHATAAHGHARQVSPGCPSPRVVSAEAAKTRLLGRAHVRRGAQATSATYRAGPSGAASGRRVEGAGGTGAVRSVGWVEAGSGRRGTTSAPEAGRNAQRKRRKRKRARPARACGLPLRRARPACRRVGRPRSRPAGGAGTDREHSLQHHAHLLWRLERSGFFFLIEHVDVVTCKVAKPPSTTDGHDETTTAL